LWAALPCVVLRTFGRTVQHSFLVLLGLHQLPVAHGLEDENMASPAGLTQPLVLWGSVIAQPNADATVPNEQLANPFGLPIEILAVRFRVYPIHSDNGGRQRTVGGSIKVKMDVGNAAIAADFPISDFGTMRDTMESEPILDSVANDALSRVSPTTYDWRLKYPLFIPVGKVLATVFTPVGLNANPVRIEVLYIGRTWDMSKPIPSRVKVPWATSFESKTFEYATGVGVNGAVSPNLDIVNPFTAPLELQRLGGRISALALQPAPFFENYIYEDLVSFRQVLSTLRIRSSRGFDIVRTPVPFDGIFPRNWRAWDVGEGWSLAPQEYYRVQIDTSAVAETIDTGQTAQAQFSVGIVGYRDVDVASLGGSK